EEYKQLAENIPKINEYQGKVTESADTLLELFKLQDNLAIRLGKLYAYSHMRNDEDTTNAKYQAMDARAESLLTIASSEMSFITPEILKADEATIKAFREENEELAEYGKVLDEINRQRPHILNEKEEELLAEMSEVTQAPSQTFNMLNNADLKFQNITDKDVNVTEFTHGRYHSFMNSTDRSVRISTFEATHNTNGKIDYNIAVRLSSEINSNKSQELVYDNLVETINDHLPLLHRYINLRKKVLELDELHMYDLYTPLVQDVDMKVTYEEAQEQVLESLKPLGTDYTDIIKEAFNNRWIDVLENVGKRSGAYSSGTYATNPYILMNWQDNVNNMFTLTHELGHSVHS